LQSHMLYIFLKRYKGLPQRNTMVGLFVNSGHPPNF
jgi:hypothetical protein